MAISSTGRYRNSTVANLDVDNSVRQVIVPSVQAPYAFRYQTYMWTDADRPDLLAQRFYGDPTAWWNIANANPEVMDWSVMTAGTIIRIPTLSGVI